jgi:Ran GTPase-activating protein (RanGAP) involved in mRNA processing and transport
MAAALAAILKFGKDNNNLKLHEINLDDNGLKDESFVLILDAIRNHSGLKILNYNNNGLGPKSVASIANLL